MVKLLLLNHFIKYEYLDYSTCFVVLICFKCLTCNSSRWNGWNLVDEVDIRGGAASSAHDLVWRGCFTTFMWFCIRSSGHSLCVHNAHVNGRPGSHMMISYIRPHTSFRPQYRFLGHHLIRVGNLATWTVCTCQKCSHSSNAKVKL